jgi:hypothetical protein
MGIFVSTLRHNSDKKTVMENKIQNNVRQYKIGKFSCDITKYDFWICGVLQVFPNNKLSVNDQIKCFVINASIFLFSH